MKRARHELWRSAEVSRLVALLSSERDYLATVLDAVPIPVAVLSENLTVESGNAAFWQVFGLAANSGVGRPVGEVAGDARAPVAVWTALEKGQPAVRLAGTEFLVSRLAETDDIILAAPGVADAPSAPQGTPQPDVAPPVREPAVPKPVPAADQFAERMRAVSRLAGGLSHELNNILTVITSYSHIVLEEMASAGLPTEDIQTVLKASGDIAKVASQLVTMGGRHVTQETPTDLGLLVSSLAAWSTENSKIEASTEGKLPPLLVDARQLENALATIVRHGFEVTHQPGTVTLTTSFNGDAETVSLTVHDTREWPDAKAGLSMFEPYAVYPGSRKSAGLELAAAWSMLRQCRADVHVSASPARGTELTIRFPTADRVRTADTAAARETVLLVDDNSEIRNAVRHMLERQGYDVMEVANPQEALRLCEQHPSIRILLSDLNMPEMSGRELAERAKRLRPELRVIIMSGYADEELDMSSLGESNLIFLQKPFTPDRLLRTVRGVVGRT